MSSLSINNLIEKGIIKLPPDSKLKIVLRDKDGRDVAVFKIHPFHLPPEVMFWEGRTFMLSDCNLEKTAWYKEVRCYVLVPPHTCERLDNQPPMKGR